MEDPEFLNSMKVSASERQHKWCFSDYGATRVRALLVRPSDLGAFGWMRWAPERGWQLSTRGRAASPLQLPLR